MGFLPANHWREETQPAIQWYGITHPVLDTVNDDETNFFWQHAYPFGDI